MKSSVERWFQKEDQSVNYGHTWTKLIAHTNRLNKARASYWLKNVRVPGVDDRWPSCVPLFHHALIAVLSWIFICLHLVHFFDRLLSKHTCIIIFVWRTTFDLRSDAAHNLVPAAYFIIGQFVWKSLNLICLNQKRSLRTMLIEHWTQSSVSQGLMMIINDCIKKLVIRPARAP